MSKDDLIGVQGMVTAVHSGGLYRVQCDPGHEVLAQLSGGGCDDLGLKLFLVIALLLVSHRTIQHEGLLPFGRDKHSR